MAELTKITTKGQLVVPQKMREKLALEASDALQVERIGELIILKKIKLEPLKKQLKEGKQ